MGNNAVIIRPYQTSDAPKIWSLIQRYTPYTRDEAFWVWINHVLPRSRSIISVAEIASEIVGHYAILPLEMSVRNDRVPCGLEVHAVVEQKHRGADVILKLTKLGYRQAADRGLKFLFGFPNAQFRDLQVKIEKWSPVKLFPAYQREGTDEARLAEGRSLEKAVSCYGDLYRILEALERSEPRAPVHLQKDLAYYSARYLDHPQNLYDCRFLRGAGEAQAFLVFKTFENGDGEKVGHLIDFVAPHPVSHEEILSAYLAHFNGQVDKLLTWPVAPSFASALERFGFRPRGFETFLATKVLDANFAYGSELANWENWSLHMGDSDTF